MKKDHVAFSLSTLPNMIRCFSIGNLQHIGTDKAEPYIVCTNRDFYRWLCLGVFRDVLGTVGF